EHLMFKGTKKRSAKEVKEAIEGRGGLLNAFTGEELTCYLAKVLSKDALVALDVLSDMTLNPKLALKDFTKERFVILEEIKMYIDMPNHYVHELLARLLWPNHPLGMPLVGTPQTISSLKQKDIVDYRDSFYNPKSIVVAIAGRFPSFDLVKVIKKRFQKEESGFRRNFSPVKIKQKEPMVDIHHRNTEQTHVALGFHGYSRFSNEKYNLDLLNVILGGNMSSRLFNEVREKLGLAYEISSSIKHYHDTGALVISAGIDNRKVDEAIKVVVDVIKGMKSKRVTKEEFQRAKEFYKGQLLMIFEDTMSHMLWLGEKFICGDFEFRAADILKRVDKVTIDGIQRVAQEILRSDNISLATVGPMKIKTEKEIRKILWEL
ncbi:MAG: insulinase family protein, partial [Candidatus Omnitrophica bacterium]|nr:insulinase family protein [Candidatus Omnitrophota bacterium]